MGTVDSVTGSSPATILVYFDASGTSADRALAVGGLIARPSQWESFDIDWSAVLEAQGLREFHMKDFAHSNGEFRPWKGDEQRRIALLKALNDVRRRHTLQTIAVSIFADEYKAFNRVFRLEEMLGGPYSCASLFAINAALTWRNMHARGEAVEVVLEQGDSGQSQLLALLKHQQMGEFVRTTVRPKRWEHDGRTRYVYAFQACDWIAYESAKANRTLIQKEDEAGRLLEEILTRKSLRLLAPEGRDMCWRYIDRRMLLEFVSRLGIRRRTAPRP